MPHPSPQLPIARLLVVLASLAGCSGSAPITVENRLDVPAQVVAFPDELAIAHYKGMEETIDPGSAMRGSLTAEPSLISPICEIERVHLQVASHDSGRWVVYELIRQNAYFIRISPGPDLPHVEQRVQLPEASEWWLLSVDFQGPKPWRRDLGVQRLPARAVGPIAD